MRKRAIKKSGKFSVARNKQLVKRSSGDYSTVSYKNFFYGGLTVMLLIAIVLGVFRIYSMNNKKNIAEEGLQVSKQEQNQENKKITEETKGATSTKTEYTVLEGDSLWKISKKLYNDGYKWTEIAKANKLENPGIIFKGDKLTIPKIESVAQTADNPDNNQTVLAQNDKQNLSSGKIEGKEYTVQHGDYLWKIALLAYGDGYKWTNIAKENKLVNPSVIHSGNKLVIPR